MIQGFVLILQASEVKGQSLAWSKNSQSHSSAINHGVRDMKRITYAVRFHYLHALSVVEPVMQMCNSARKIAYLYRWVLACDQDLGKTHGGWQFINDTQAIIYKHYFKTGLCCGTLELELGFENSGGFGRHVRQDGNYSYMKTCKDLCKIEMGFLLLDYRGLCQSLGRGSDFNYCGLNPITHSSLRPIKPIAESI